MESRPSREQLIEQAEVLLKEAASILICNWSDMSYAIEQGLSGKNRKLNLEDEKEIEELQALVSYIKGERKSDLALRGELINMMVDLGKRKVTDFVAIAEDIELSDFEDCLLDFMDLKFSMSLEDNSAKEVSEHLLLTSFLLDRECHDASASPTDRECDHQGKP